MSLFPRDAVVVDAPVVKVTLLEDRAQVLREARLALSSGQHALVVADVAPVLQDLSLRAEASAGTVSDVRARRAFRIAPAEKPEHVEALEEQIEARARAYRELAQTRTQLATTRARLEQVLGHSLREIPVDVSWGLPHAQWQDTLEKLLARLRELDAQDVELSARQDQLSEEWTRLVAQRRALDRPDATFVTWLEADLVLAEAATITVQFSYTVPNALWRPLHAARLADGQLTFESRACVWQNTGEDWKDVSLVFSTARSSLGVEAPLLSDDLLSAQKKSETLVIQAREVAVQRATVTGGAPAPSGPQRVELPGVDDGGEVLSITAAGRCTVPSDGRPAIVPLFSFTASAAVKLVAYPELELRVFLTSTQRNEAAVPVLAGPVELLLDHGFVGWTRVLFVAPGELFRLSFGPDASLRLSRADRERTREPRDTDWKTVTRTVWLYVSSLSDEARRVEVVERVPVSELEQVTVSLVPAKTQPPASADANGFVTWTVEVPPRGQTQLQLAWELSTAPGVQGVV